MKHLYVAAALLFAGAALAETKAPAILFSPTEDALFRQLVARDAGRRVALSEAPVVGAFVPWHVELHRFPGGLMAEVPSTRTHRYVTTDAGIAVVDPDTRRIVQIFPHR